MHTLHLSLLASSIEKRAICFIKLESANFYQILITRFNVIVLLISMPGYKWLNWNVEISNFLCNVRSNFIFYSCKIVSVFRESFLPFLENYRFFIEVMIKICLELFQMIYCTYLRCLTYSNQKRLKYQYIGFGN